MFWSRFCKNLEIFRKLRVLCIQKIGPRPFVVACRMPPSLDPLVDNTRRQKITFKKNVRNLSISC